MTQDIAYIEKIAEQYPHMGINGSATVFHNFESVATYAIGLIDSGDHHQLKQLFEMVEGISKACCQQTKMAIENVFVYRMGTRIELEGTTGRHRLAGMVPNGLKKMMLKQLNCSGQ